MREPFDSDIHLQVAQRVRCTEAEGPGRRFAVWLQGCPLRCPECCNPEMLSFTGGESVSLAALLGEVRTAAAELQVEGVTLLGGEPIAHAGAGAAAFAAGAQAQGLSVMVFSGFTLAEIRQMPDPAVHQLLSQTDILVDGPYLRELPESQRRWIGSANQQIHFLTNRYSADDACWREPNTLEVRLVDGEVVVNGFPAAGATALWKRQKNSASDTRRKPNSATND